MPPGQPTLYSIELADVICERLACGESLRSVCRDDAMPCMATIFNWLRIHKVFLEQYTRSKEESADALYEDMLDIADNEVSQPLIVEGKAVMVDGKPVMVIDAVSVNHARLRIDTRKWAASKMKPKKYGEKTETKHTGTVTLEGYELSETERSARIAAILDAGRSRRDGEADS